MCREINRTLFFTVRSMPDLRLRSSLKMELALHLVPDAYGIVHYFRNRLTRPGVANRGKICHQGEWHRVRIGIPRSFCTRIVQHTLGLLEDRNVVKGFDDPARRSHRCSHRQYPILGAR